MSVYAQKMDKFATDGVIRRKNDLHCSAAELVYGTTLRLPAAFFQSSGSNSIDQVAYVTRLKEMMMKLQATPTHHHMKARPFVSTTTELPMHKMIM